MHPGGGGLRLGGGLQVSGQQGGQLLGGLELGGGEGLAGHNVVLEDLRGRRAGWGRRWREGGREEAQRGESRRRHGRSHHAPPTHRLQQLGLCQQLGGGDVQCLQGGGKGLVSGGKHGGLQAAVGQGGGQAGGLQAQAAAAGEAGSGGGEQGSRAGEWCRGAEQAR